MKELNEASYGRIYQHTKSQGQFAIIGSEDKDTHKNRYSELKLLVKRYERKYGHLGYNKLYGTYQYQLTGRITNEESLIIYGISKKDALSIAQKINQESIIWKDDSFFGILNVKGNILQRFKKSTMNFSKAIKQGIGSRLQSDQSRTFGYAFEGRKIMNKKSLSESISSNLKESNILDLYNLYDEKEYSDESAGKTFEEICRECAQEIISGVDSAEVKDINLDNDGASLYIVTNNGFAAWLDYWIDNNSTEVEGDLPENEVMGDWNAYIFHTDDPGDMITKYVQEDDDVFMFMESEGRDYLITNGYVKETPIKRTNGMEVSHYEWQKK